MRRRWVRGRCMRRANEASSSMASVRYRIGPGPCATFFSSAGRGGRAPAFAVPAPWIGSLFADLHSFLPRSLVHGPCGVRFVYTPVWPTTHRHGAGSTYRLYRVCPLLVPGAIQCAAHGDPRDAAVTFTSQTRLGSTGLMEEEAGVVSPSPVRMPVHVCRCRDVR
jgi:hypothetical protein